MNHADNLNKLFWHILSVAPISILAMLVWAIPPVLLLGARNDVAVKPASSDGWGV